MFTIVLTTHTPTKERFVHLQYSFTMLMNTIPSSTEVIVYDNEVGDESREFFKTMGYRHSFIYHHMGENTGMAIPKNLGLQEATNKTVLFTDNDIYYKPGWYGILAPMTTNNKRIITPLPCNKKYLVKRQGATNSYSKISPGVILVPKDECPVWKDVNIPGRVFLRDAKKAGFRFFGLSTPMAIHMGANETTWYED